MILINSLLKANINRRHSLIGGVSTLIRKIVMARSKNNTSIFIGLVLWITFIAAASALMTFTKTAHADSIDIILTSRHTIEGDFNERNPGFAYSRGNGHGLTGGIYRNSFYETSVFAGYYTQTEEPYLNIGIVGGLITGYEQQTGKEIFPLALPYVLIGPKAVRARIGALPGVFTFSMQVAI